MRGEVKFTVPTTAATRSLCILSYKKKKKKTCSLSAVITVENERNAVNCVGGLIIALYRNYND